MGDNTEDWDKENAPNRDTAPSCLPVAREDMTAESVPVVQPRAPLAELNPGDFYPDGYNLQSVILHPNFSEVGGSPWQYSSGHSD